MRPRLYPGFLFGYFVFTSVAQANSCKNNGVGGYMAAFANLMMLTGAWFPEDDVETKVRLETSESGCSKGLRKDYERITGSGNESD